MLIKISSVTWPSNDFISSIVKLAKGSSSEVSVSKLASSRCCFWSKLWNNESQEYSGDFWSLKWFTHICIYKQLYYIVYIYVYTKMYTFIYRDMYLYKLLLDSFLLEIMLQVWRGILIWHYTTLSSVVSSSHNKSWCSTTPTLAKWSNLQETGVEVIKNAGPQSVCSFIKLKDV